MAFASDSDQISDQSNTVTQTTAKAADKPADKRLSLLGFLSTQSGLQHTDDPNYSAETDFTLLPSYKISDSYSVIGAFGFKQELTQQQRILGSNGMLGIGHKAIKLNPFISFSPSVGMGIPISDQSRNVDTMYTSGIGMVSLSLDGAGIGVKPLSVVYYGTASRTFYQYYSAADGKTNIEYELKHTGWITYGFTDKLSYMQTLIYAQGWNYLGNTTGKFEFDEELDYQLVKGIALGVGVSNSGDVQAANKQDSNVDIYNPNSASIYGSLILKYVQKRIESGNDHDQIQ